MAPSAASASQVGGMRNESCSEVEGRRTLPARFVGGSPSAPTTLSVGRQVWARICSTGSSEHRSGVADEVVAVGVGRRRRRRLLGLTAAVVRDRHVELRHPDLTGRGVLHPLEQLAGDAERARHHAAGRAGVDALLEDVDRQRAAGQSPQRRRDPQPVVVVAAGVEADDERRRRRSGRPGPPGGRAGRASRSPRWPRRARGSGRGRRRPAARPRWPPARRTPRSRRRRHRGRTAGRPPPPASTARDRRASRASPAACPGGRRAARCRRRGPVAEGGDLDDDERRAAGQLGDVDGQAGDRAGAAPVGHQVDGPRRCGRWRPSRRRRPGTALGMAM